jgi:hypothetical protein
MRAQAARAADPTPHGRVSWSRLRRAGGRREAAKLGLGSAASTAGETPPPRDAPTPARSRRLAPRRPVTAPARLNPPPPPLPPTVRRGRRPPRRSRWSRMCRITWGSVTNPTMRAAPPQPLAHLDLDPEHPPQQLRPAPPSCPQRRPARLRLDRVGPLVTRLRQHDAARRHHTRRLGQSANPTVWREDPARKGVVREFVPP